MTSTSAITRLRQKLTAALDPLELRIDDDSAKHIGHPGAASGGHYRVFIVSKAFTERPLIARHRMVYEAVRDDLRRDVHALSIVARSPSEVAPSDGPEPSNDSDEDDADD